MKTLIQFSALTDSQKAQIFSFYQEEVEKEQLFEHDLNKRSFLINISNGNVIFRKDF